MGQGLVIVTKTYSRGDHIAKINGLWAIFSSFGHFYLIVCLKLKALLRYHCLREVID